AGLIVATSVAAPSAVPLTVTLPSALRTPLVTQPVTAVPATSASRSPCALPSEFTSTPSPYEPATASPAAATTVTGIGTASPRTWRLPVRKVPPSGPSQPAGGV